MSPRIAASTMRHWFPVRFCWRSRSSSMAFPYDLILLRTGSWSLRQPRFSQAFRAFNILEPLLAQISELGGRGRDIPAVTQDVIAFDQYVPEIDADAKQ